MKTILTVCIVICCFYSQKGKGQNGNVGIGTNLPLARLHVTDGSLLFSANGLATSNPGLAIQGQGRRFMWHHDKVAFRVGYVDGNQWDPVNLGNYSFASGISTIASGHNSIAMGIFTVASNNNSIAIGAESVSSGEMAFATGYSTTASGLLSYTFGERTTAKSGYETVFGKWNTDYVPATTIDWMATDRLFTIGNGTSYFTRSDAMVVLKNGNTGFGTSTPTNKLHIRLGNSGAAPLLANTPLVVENSQHTYINLINAEEYESGLIFGKPSDAASGGIVYNNAYTLNGFQFRTNGNQTNMVIAANGNVGIGTVNPNAPLAFPPWLGKKITLYPGATGDVGMAVQGNLLQIYSDNPNADIAFGYDQAGTMTERMRIKGNGNVGIGTNNPLYPLDINGSMRLSGGLNVNGTEGASGQVLQSGGQGGAANWSSVSTWLFNNSHQIVQTLPITIPSPNMGDIPGMSYSDYSVIVNSTSKLIVSLDVRIESIGCFSCGASFAQITTYIRKNADIPLSINGYGSAGNTQFSTITTGIKVLTVAPGTYTFYSFVLNTGGPLIRVTDAKLLIVVIPQ